MDSNIHKPLVLAGLGMMLVGIGFKLFLFPFQFYGHRMYTMVHQHQQVYFSNSEQDWYRVVMRFIPLKHRRRDSETLRMILGFMVLLPLSCLVISWR